MATPMSYSTTNLKRLSDRAREVAGYPVEAQRAHQMMCARIYAEHPAAYEAALDATDDAYTIPPPPHGETEEAWLEGFIAQFRAMKTNHELFEAALEAAGVA